MRLEQQHHAQQRDDDDNRAAHEGNILPPLAYFPTIGYSVSPQLSQGNVG